MGRKKNSFSKAIKHLKSKNIDEKLEMLNEIPTNNTSSIYSVVPNSITVGVDVSQTVPDFSTVDFEVNGNDGRDTSGLFDESGNSKFIAPPGDNSYILGPMAAMYYTWSTPWTKIGYIRESDRRMVNLGTIYSTLHLGGDFNGKLSDWDGNLRDGNGIQVFYANGQLTLEQAQWFLNTPKKDNAGNDPANANYRAFYPGPPSNAADEFGRYLCTMTGTPKGTREDIISRSTAPIGQQGSDNFSAILARLGLQGGLTGNINWNKVGDAINKGMLAADVIAVLGILFPEPGTSIAGAARLATRLSGLKGIKQSLRNRFLRGALNPFGQRTVRSGIAGRARVPVYSGRPYTGKRGFGNTTYGTTDISTARTYTNPGALKGLRGTGAKTNPKGTLDRGTLPQRYIDKYGSRSVTGQKQIKLGKKAAKKVFGDSYEIDRNILSEDKIDSQIENFMQVVGKLGKKELNNFFEKLLDYLEDAVDQEGEQQVAEQKKILSESRKTNIMKTLKDPIVIRETKQKSYKVKPGRRSKKSNYHQGMDKLIGDVKPQKSFKKPQNMWSQGWQEYNARSSQDRKNIVLEKIGESKHAWKYMLEHGTMMDAKNLEEFWGKNPDFYSYFFNGKKYKTVRKEQVKGDYVVFLVDESGVKSSMLQSELNIKLIEEEEEKMLAEYNKLNNIESIPYEKDPLFKKVSKKLKKEIDYPEKPAKKGYPNQPPPKLGPDGFHPGFGKKYRYDKLDPISATTMSNAPTGNPEIDANVKKASLKSKVKEGYSDWRSEIEKKKA